MDLPSPPHLQARSGTACLRKVLVGRAHPLLGPLPPPFEGRRRDEEKQVAHLQTLLDAPHTVEKLRPWLVAL